MIAIEIARTAVRYFYLIVVHGTAGPSVVCVCSSDGGGDGGGGGGDGGLVRTCSSSPRAAPLLLTKPTELRLYCIHNTLACGAVAAVV